MKNPTTFITKDGVSDADLIRAARDMYELLQVVDRTLVGVDGRTAEHLRRLIGLSLIRVRQS